MACRRTGPAKFSTNEIREGSVRDLFRAELLTWPASVAATPRFGRSGDPVGCRLVEIEISTLWVWCFDRSTFRPRLSSISVNVSKRFHGLECLRPGGFSPATGAPWKRADLETAIFTSPPRHWPARQVSLITGVSEFRLLPIDMGEVEDVFAKPTT